MGLADATCDYGDSMSNARACELAETLSAHEHPHPGLRPDCVLFFTASATGVQKFLVEVVAAHTSASVGDNNLDRRWKHPFGQGYDGFDGGLLRDVVLDLLRFLHLERV